MPPLITDPAGITGMMARANRRWSTPGGAIGECYVASSRLQLALHERGHLAQLLKAQAEGANHYAVLLYGLVADLTVRQFDPFAPYPLLEPRPAWEARMVTTLGLVGAGAFGPVRFAVEPHLAAW